MNKHIFREYDIRGVVGEDLTEEVTELIGRGYGSYVDNLGVSKVSVGRDVRLSSPMLRDSLIKGITSTGVDVIDIGEVPTPLSYFSYFHLDVDGGIMITGSHNPPDFNGFKLGVNKASLYGPEIMKIYEIIYRGNFSKGKGKIETYEIIEPYIDEISKKIFLGNNTVDFAIDAGNGAGGLVVPDIFKRCGLNPISLFCEPDGRFPNHHPDPTVDKYLVDLIRTVKEKKLDIGIAYDGDADRIGIVDKKGKIVRGDILVGILARDLLTRQKGAKIVFDVKCSQGLEEYIKQYGGVPVMWKTGHSLLKSKMKEIGSPFSGEMSGHLFFGENYYGYDDAILASLKFIEILSKSDETFTEIVNGFLKYYSTPEIRAESTDKDKTLIVEKAKQYFRNKYKTIEIDGVRIVYPDGWGLIRQSNTQLVIVLRFEAKSEERLNEIKNEVTDKLKEFGNIKI